MGVAMWMVWGEVVYARAGEWLLPACEESRLVIASALDVNAAFLRVMSV